jgi:hypothetical protein
MHRHPVPAVLALAAVISLASVLPAIAQNALPPDPCRHITHADVVALDQAFYNNRLGAFQAGGMIFALRRDVVSTDPKHAELRAGFVMVRPTKRPRRIGRASCGEGG